MQELISFSNDHEIKQLELHECPVIFLVCNSSTQSFKTLIKPPCINLCSIVMSVEISNSSLQELEIIIIIFLVPVTSPINTPPISCKPTKNKRVFKRDYLDTWIFTCIISESEAPILITAILQRFVLLQWYNKHCHRFQSTLGGKQSLYGGKISPEIEKNILLYQNAYEFYHIKENTRTIFKVVFLKDDKYLTKNAKDKKMKNSENYTVLLYIYFSTF